LETTLHTWVAFAIMPLFALANAGVAFTASDLFDPIAIAIGAGLVIGKPIGIVGFSWLAVRMGFAALPQGVTWGLVLAGGLLTGIGFTMALFICGLALDAEFLDAAKVGVLAASVVAAVLGMFVMMQLLPKQGDTEG
jgi:NhaA family Na+:H+ antiporter